MKPINLVVLFAPLALTLADVVDSAPAGAAGVARDISAHRRAVADVPSSPWHRRYSDNARRQNAPAAGDSSTSSTSASPSPNVPLEGIPDPASTPANTSTNTAPSDPGGKAIAGGFAWDRRSAVPTGPPAVIVVPTGDTTTSSSSSTETSSSSSSESSSSSTTSSSSSTPADPTTPAPSDPASTDVNTSTNTVDQSTLTANPTTPTDPGTTTPVETSSSTDTPIIVLPTLPTISLPTISLPTLLPDPSATESSSSSGNNDPGTSTGGPSESPTGNPTDTETSTGTPSGTPTDPETSTPPSSTSSSSSSRTPPVLDPTSAFPTDTDTSVSPTVTIIDTATSSRSLTIDSQFQFLTASSFITDSSFSTSTSLTLTNPDEALTTPTLSAGSATTLVVPAIPSTLPLFITPPESADPLASGLNLPGYTEISILFQLSVRWTFVLNSSETAAQIIAYMPQIIKYALDSDPDSVRTIGLSAYQTTSYRTPEDLMTLWGGYLKTELVQELAAMVKVGTSDFYKISDPVAQAIAKSVVGSYDIASVNGVSNTNGSSNPSSTTTQVDNSRRNAVIGVCVSFGLIALIVIGWWIMRMYKARKEGMHKRLSYEGQTNYGAAGQGVAAGGYGAAGMRPDSPPNLNNPFMTEREREEEARGIRRNSFYAIGPDDASLEEETFDYMSQRSSGGLNRAHSGGHSGWANSNTLTVPGSNGASRRPVVGQPISQPILRESSMGNW
ncbi:hypothetical protein PIIN_01453 [Serendipita indica DSM 11827]|uniref:Uncharacterized protein n=1 Tax=Serendipita indica (strain DSM 11827) TaxID=1109443 RepID=G4T8L1_SERID|nr:hypothetical protein PIIN_01453 [Serendipita indica DSM 11827]